MAQFTYIHRVQQWLEGFQQDTLAAESVDDSHSPPPSDLGALVDMALGLHALITRIEASWGREVEEGKTPYNIPDAEAIQQLFALWLPSAQKLAAAIRLADQQGVAVANGLELRKAVARCYQPLIDIRETHEIFERFKNGEGEVVAPE